MKKTISLLLLLMCITLMLQAQVSKTVNCTAGGLSSALTASEKSTITNLTLTGSIDARDFKTMRDNMPVLAVLDMSRVSISTYIGTEGTDDYQNSTVYAVNTIPACAFSGPGNNWGKKSLTKVVLPENITVIGNWSFEKCTGITSLNIPSTVSIIGEQAMLGLNLDTINIPFAVKTIGENAFLQNGANIVVAKENHNYSSVDGVLFDKDMKLIMHCPVSKSGRYTMPLSVEEIGLNAFNSCTELTDVVSSSRLRIIGNCAFMACSKLKTISFPSTLTRISSAAFSSCSNLESVNLPNSVTEVSIGAFQFCTNMKSIFIPASVKILEQGVLLSSNGFVTVDENNTNYSSLNGDLYDKAKTTIYHCPISKTGIFNLPSSVKNVDEGAFYNCKLLTSIEIPQSVNRIRANAFEYCAGLTSLNIPSSVKKLENCVLLGCSNLTIITIPESVDSIGNNALAGCFALKSIFSKRITPIDLSLVFPVFDGVDKSQCVLYVPVGSVPAYRSAAQWQDFYNIVEMAPVVTDVNNITTIAGELFTHILSAARDTLTTLTVKGTIDARDFKFMRDSLPVLAYLDIENVDVVAYSGTEGTDPYHNLYPEDAIPNYAFFNELKQEGKTSLSKIVFPITVNSIGISAFSKCTGFRGEFTMPSTVTSICRYAFMYCTGLTSINLSSSLKIIEYDSFLGCSSLSGTLNIPPSVTTICIGAFAECVNLDTVIVPSTVILIGEMAFAGAGGFIKVDIDNMNYSDIDGVLFNKQQNIIIQCTISNRGSYNIPSTVSEIANYSFYRCNNLTSILIPNKVTYIGDYAFNNCKGLKGTIIIPSSVKTLGELSFGSCSSLDSIIFPSSVTSVESYTFFGCSGLTSFCTYNVIPNDLSSSFLVFGNVDKTTCTLYVPYGSKKLYEIADQWKDFIHIVEMGGIDLSDISITLPSGGGSDSTVISTKAVWSATSDQSWLTVTPSSGTGNDTLVFTAEPNLTDSERTATVTVKAADVSSQVVTITQKSALVLSVSNNNLFIAKEIGSFVSVNVTSNIEWTAQSNQTWLKLTPSAGTGNKTIQFSANNANPTIAPRMAIVTISGIDVVPQLITVTQAAGDSILTVASTAVNVGYADGSSVSVPVTSNIIWAAQSDQLWLTVAPSAANGKDTLVFTAEVNPVDSIRTAIVTVSATGLPSKTIVVTQLRKPFLNVSANDVAIAKEYGSKASIEVISNIVWTASSFQAWLRVSPKSETGNQSLYFTVTSANPKITPRSANVIVNGEGVSPQQITITQAAGDTVLTVGSTAVDIGFAEGSTVSVPVTSNTTWTVQSDQIWLTVAPSAATGNGTLVFTAGANPVDSTRTAIVTVSATGVAPRTIIVTQSRKSFLNVSANTVAIANEYDSSVSVEVNSNIVWNASSDHTWLKVSPKSGSGNQSLIFTTASANTEIAPRSATVTVAGEGVSPQLITVIQAAGDTVLTVDSTTVDIGYAEGSTVSVQVISNTTWKAQSDQPWLTPNPVLFEGNTDLIFTANENPNDFTRTAKISVMAPGAETKTITITQAAKPALNLMTDTLLIAKEEGSTVTLFIISANVEWRVESEEPWLSVDPESGFFDGTLTLTATANPGVGKRSSVVSISADGVGVKQVVVIQEAGDPTLILSGNSVFVEKEEGSTATVTITSNTNWSVSTDQSWLEVSPATNTGNARLIITAKLNPTIDECKATVTVYEDGIEPRLITVTQEAGDPVISILGEDIYIAPEEGSMVTIEVVSNTSWTVSTDQPWLTFTPLTGTGNGIITLTAKENPFAIDRPAHVTITDGEAISQTIDVVQSAGNVGTSDIKMGAVSIYPNPVTNVFRINGLIGKSEIFVTDLSGKILFSKEIDGDEYITVTSLEKGIYILRITNAEGQIEKKLIKE